MFFKRRILLFFLIAFLGVPIIVFFNPEARAKRLITRGIEEAKRNNLNTAGLIFQKAAQICPECYLARYNLGNVFLAVNRYDEALNEFYAAASIRPADPQPLYEIARLHAILNHQETSLFYLEQSIINGFSDIKRLNNDPDFFKFHNEDRFKNLIKLWESRNEKGNIF